MKRQPTFATIMAQYIGKPFRPGAYGPDAYDCVGLVYRYLLDTGKNIPDHYQQWNAGNYFTLACGAKKREDATAREWLLSMGREISVGEMIAGDIVMVRMLARYTGLMIYCGNRMAITVVDNRGVIPVKLNNNMGIIMVVRI